MNLKLNSMDLICPGVRMISLLPATVSIPMPVPSVLFLTTSRVTATHWFRYSLLANWEVVSACYPSQNSEAAAVNAATGSSSSEAPGVSGRRPSGPV